MIISYSHLLILLSTIILEISGSVGSNEIILPISVILPVTGSIASIISIVDNESLSTSTSGFSMKSNCSIFYT